MKKKKILFIIDSLGGGGAEKVLIDLLENIDRDKFDVNLVVLAKIGQLIDKVPKDVKVKFVFPSKVIYYAIMFLPPKFLYKLFIKEEYDVEVSFLEGRCTKFGSGSPNKKSRKIAWVHIDLINNHWSKPYFRKLQQEIDCYNKFDKIVCVSNEVKDAFVKMFGIKDKVVFKQNIINDGLIKEKANANVDLSMMDKSVPALVTIGRLNHQKGYDRLLRVVKRLNDDNLKFNLYILGEGGERKTLESYIEENNLNNVNLLGFNSNPYPYLKNADLFVCSSRSEGFSTVISESIILNVPIITTDCAGMKEQLGDSKYGLIVENDENALYEGMKAILTDESLYEKYKESVKARSEIFNMNMLLSQIQELFL